jgi:hypothetical protein
MDTPARPGTDLGAAYRRRRRLVNLTSIPFFVLAAVALLSRITSGRFLGIPFSVAGPVAYITFLVSFVVHIIIWRCPACEGYLGLIGSSKFCPKCGARLGGGAEGEAKPGRMMISSEPKLGFKIWTAALSVFVAVVLYPNIVGRHGIAKSLVITALAVAAIWMIYAVIGRVINGAVARELKRRSGEKPGGPPEPKA